MNEIIKLYKSGKSFHAICRELNIGTAKIREALRAGNVKIRTRGNPSGIPTRKGGYVVLSDDLKRNFSKDILSEFEKLIY